MRRATVFLVIFLAVLFNIERIDLGRTNIIDISSLVYVLVLVAVATILAVRSLTRLRVYVLVGGWIIVYFITRLEVAYFQERPMWGGIFTYLTITELSLLVIAILLARNVALHLDDFEEAVRNITLADIQHRVYPLNNAYGEIQREFARSRRQNYPLSVMVVEPDPQSVQVTLNRSVLEIQKAMMTRYMLTSLMRIISGLTRRVDIIISQATKTDSVVIFSPDTDNEQAYQLADRLRDEISKQLGVQVCCGLASFPDEALTFEELIETAEKKIECEKDLALIEQREIRTAV